MSDITYNIDWIIQRLLDRPMRRGGESNDEMRARRQGEREKAAAALTALQAQARESALEALSAYGQATEAYAAQMAAEAKLAKAVDALEKLNVGEGWAANIARAALAAVKGATP
jgi:predicted ArsR family transcriptional regulator